MRSLLIIGVILLAVATGFFYIADFKVRDLFESAILMGIICGIGIGLIIGGVVGYVSKGVAIKTAQKEKEFKALQKEKEKLEKQVANLSDTHSNSGNTI